MIQNFLYFPETIKKNVFRVESNNLKERFHKENRIACKSKCTKLSFSHKNLKKYISKINNEIQVETLVFLSFDDFSILFRVNLAHKE